MTTFILIALLSLAVFVWQRAMSARAVLDEKLRQAQDDARAAKSVVVELTREVPVSETVERLRQGKF